MCGCCSAAVVLISSHEPLGAEHGGELGLEDLERDLAVVLEVLGEVDGGHAALAQLALDAVAVGEGGGEASRASAQSSATCPASFARQLARTSCPTIDACEASGRPARRPTLDIEEALVVRMHVVAAVGLLRREVPAFGNSRRSVPGDAELGAAADRDRHQACADATEEQLPAVPAPRPARCPRRVETCHSADASTVGEGPHVDLVPSRTRSEYVGQPPSVGRERRR